MINPLINKIIAPPPSSASANPAKSSPEVASAEKFGAVLAKQIGEKPSADSKRSTHPSDKKSPQTGPSVADEQIPLDQPAMLTTADPLAGFLKGNLTIKVDRPTDAQADQTTQPADAQITPFALPVNPELRPPVLTTADPATGKSARQAAEPLGAAREKMTGVTPAAGEQPTIATKTLTLTDKEAFKLAEPANSLPAVNAQAMAQSASSAITLLPTPMAPTNQATIAAQLGSPAWPAEFTQKINWVSTQQNQVAELHLNPPDLGPMSVTITINDNQATALFSSPHSAVREAIENAMPKLRESLADNGIMLGNATVNDQAPRDSGASGFTNQRTPSPQTHTTTETVINPVPVVHISRHNGLVDTFA